MRSRALTAARLLFVLLWLLASFTPTLVRAQGTGNTVDPVFGGASLGLLGKVGKVLVQPDGKLLVAGAFERGLLRLNPDGSLDTGFNASASDTVFPVALQPDGKVLSAEPSPR